MAPIQIDPDLEEEFREIAERSGCELLHSEFVGRELRLVLERPEGVSLDDCQMVSKQVSTLLDVHDFGSGKYTLQVSSPGLDRRFYGSKDYERFLGRSVRLTWQEPTMPTKQTVVGRLQEFRPSDDDGTVTLVDSATGHSYNISLKDIHLARLEPKF